MIRNRSPFERSHEELASVLSAAGRFVAREYSTPTSRPILPRVPQVVFDALIQGEMPNDGMPLSQASEQMQSFLANYTARFVGPGFSAMITTSPNPYALLAEILACAVNQHAMRGDVSEFAARLEERVIQWIGDFIGYPAASGTLTSGGASANLVALAVARACFLGRSVRRVGLKGVPLVAYTSTEAHVSIRRAIDLLGLGTDNLRGVAVDEHYRLDTALLQQAIRDDRAAGRIPFAVIAQGGSVSTGAVDDLGVLGEICQRENIWMHVDAAYGGPAAQVPSTRHLFKGLAQADSVSVDPHKWLYVNYDCGCVVLRQAGALESTFASDGATYLQADSPTDAPDFMYRGIDFSRPFRALKVWATFAGLGAKKLRAAISQDILLARQVAELIAESGQFVLFSPPSLSIVVFQFLPGKGLSDRYVDALNARIPAALRADGRMYLGSATVSGRIVLRMCLVNHRVTDGLVADWLSNISVVGSKVHSERRQWWDEKP